MFGGEFNSEKRFDDELGEVCFGELCKTLHVILTAYVRFYLVLFGCFKISCNYFVAVETFHRLFTRVKGIEKNGLLPVKDVIYHINDSLLISSESTLDHRSLPPVFESQRVHI